MTQKDEVFGQYAGVYDSLYHDKDYSGETDFVIQLLNAHSNGETKSILDMGCGTGGHAIPLAKHGYSVTGVDRSEGMLEQARDKAQAAGHDIAFHQGDVRNVNLNQTFDAVIFMFAVVAYQTSNADLNDALQTARHHLKPGGLLIFDTWNGPAVLADPPTDRVREVPGPNGTRIIRITRPVHDSMAQTIDVQFHVLTLDGDKVSSEIQEAHLMRYLFPQELGFHLKQAGFNLLQACPFMRPDLELSATDWNMSIVAAAT